MTTKAWEDRAAYLRTLQEAIHAIHRESDQVQIGAPSTGLAALENVRQAQAVYAGGETPINRQRRSGPVRVSEVSKSQERADLLQRAKGRKATKKQIEWLQSLFEDQP